MSFLRQILHRLGFALGITWLAAMGVGNVAAQIVWDNGSGDSKWTTSKNWNPNGKPGSNADLTFDASAVTSNQTISLNGNQQAGTLTFGGGYSYTFNSSSNTLQLNSSGTNFTQNASAAVTFNTPLALVNGLNMTGTGAGTVTFKGAISGSGGFTTDGSFTTILSAANTYSGATTVNGGTLKFNATNALPTTTALSIGSAGTVDLQWYAGTVGSLSGSGTLKTGSTFTVGDSTNTSFSGQITSGYGGLVKNGTGILTLSGNNSYGGTTIINQGAIVAASSTALGSSTWGNVVASGAELDLAGNITLAEGSFGVSGSGLSGQGVLRSTSGNNAYAGALNLNADSTIGADAGASLAISGQLSLNSVLTTTGAGNITLSGQISNSAGLIHNGTGLLTLSNQVSNGAGITINGTGSLTASGVINGSGGFTMNSTGALTFAGSSSNSFSGALQINTGTVDFAMTGGATAAANAINVGDGLGAANSAVLHMGGDNQIANYDTAVAILSDGKLDVGGTSQTFTGLTSAGNITVASSGSLSLNALTDTGTTDVASSGTLSLGYNSGSSSLGGTLTGSGTVIKTGSGALTISGATSNTFNGSLQVNNGTVTMSKSGSGNYAMSGGTVTVGDASSNTAVLTMGGSNQFAPTGTSMTVASNGKFDVAGTSQSLDSIASSGIVNVASGGALNLGATNASSSLGGTLTGSGSVVKSGTGSLTVSGTSSNAFNGSLQINDGTVVLSKSGSGVYAMSGGTLTIGDSIGSAGSAVLQMGGNNQLSSLVSSVAIASEGKLDIAGTTQSINALTSAGILNVDSAGSLTLGASGGSSTLGGSLTGAGSLVKSGAGSLSIGSSQSFSGSLTLGSGSLLLSGITFTLGTLHITGNSTIDFGGASSAILDVSNLIIDAGVTLSITNWVDSVDHFYATNWQGATLDVSGSSPMNQVTFNGGSGSDTVWSSFYPSGSGYEIRPRPVPEPSAYGAVMGFACLAAFWLTKRRRARNEGAKTGS